MHLLPGAKAPSPILAAGGIVLGEGSRPRIAIVRLRRDKSWVLPKGKLYPGETTEFGVGASLTAARDELDLTDQRAVLGWMHNNRPQAVFLAAARVGGILANDSRPVEFLRDNLLIETADGIRLVDQHALHEKALLLALDPSLSDLALFREGNFGPRLRSRAQCVSMKVGSAARRTHTTRARSAHIP